MNKCLTVFKICNILLVIIVIFFIVLSIPSVNLAVRRDRKEQVEYTVNLQPEAAMEIANMITEYTYGTGYLETMDEMSYSNTQMPNIVSIEKYNLTSSCSLLINVENGELLGIY